MTGGGADGCGCCRPPAPAAAAVVTHKSIVVKREAPGEGGEIPGGDTVIRNCDGTPIRQFRDAASFFFFSYAVGRGKSTVPQRCCLPWLTYARDSGKAAERGVSGGGVLAMETYETRHAALSLTLT